MDIAAMSMDMASGRLQQAVGIAMTKKTMDAQEVQAAGLFKMLDAAAPKPPSDHIIDVKV